jgi:hypothetical protein
VLDIQEDKILIAIGKVFAILLAVAKLVLRGRYNIFGKEKDFTSMLVGTVVRAVPGKGC